MSVLNNLASQVPPAEGNSGGGVHPVGTFEAVVVKVTQSFNQKAGKPMYSISTKTSEGFPPDFVLWGFSDQEIAAMEYNKDLREKAITNIGYFKRLLKDVLNPPDQKIQNATWDDMIQMLGFLKGKTCAVDVRPDKKDTRYIKTYIRASQNSDQEQTAESYPQDQYNNNHPVQTYQQPVQQAPSYITFPASANLNSIPF